MKNETVIELISELTATLSAVAVDSNGRVAKVAEAVAVTADFSEAELVEYARIMLAERRMRRSFLPSELFHEPAWDMLGLKPNQAIDLTGAS